MLKNERIFKIGLFGPWGGNLGCAATADAMIQNICKNVPDPKIVIFSMVPTDTEERHGITSYPIGREDWSCYQHTQLTIWIRDCLLASPFPIIKRLEFYFMRVPIEFRVIKQTYLRLKQLDLLIVTGGGQLLDFWGKFQHPYWLFKYAILSRLAGTRFLFVSVGAGPIRGKLSGFFIKAALSLAAYRSYRDIESKVYVERVLGFKKNDPVYPDLVYSLQLEDQKRNNNGRPVVGLGVMAYCNPQNWPEKDFLKYQNYLNKLASFIRWLMDKQYFISLIVGEVGRDQLAIKDLIGILEKEGVMTLAGEQIRGGSIETVKDLLGKISETDFVVASRFHNILLPTQFGIPVIALSYHQKTDALMADLGQSHYCLPIEQFDVDTLKARFVDLESNCEIIKKQLSEKALDHKIALDEQYERIFGPH